MAAGSIATGVSQSPYTMQSQRSLSAGRARPDSQGLAGGSVAGGQRDLALWT